MSRPRVNESLEQDFIKVILTKDQERNKRNKKGVRIRKSKCIELDGAHFYTRKFNVALSLYRVLGITLYFSKSFLEAAAKAPWFYSWNRSPTCSLLHHNRGTGCSQNTSCTHY